MTASQVVRTSFLGPRPRLPPPPVLLRILMKMFQKPYDETPAHVPYFKTTRGYKLAKTWHPVVAVLQQSAAFSSLSFPHAQTREENHAKRAVVY